jgi:2-polyprenyl-6-hydroxyphenyl methylase/3-demethylubiquinone-9 3-methyltransferase
MIGVFKKESGRPRGMELMTDIRDWLGGWPMEFVLDDEVVNFVDKLGFHLKNIKKGEACTEFLFQRND